MTGADLLEAWQTHLRDAKRRSPHTVRAYTAAAQRLIHHADCANFAEIARIEAPQLRRFLAERRAQGLSNASAARELSACKAFIAFARSEAGDPDPTAPRLRGPRVKKGLPRPVTPDDAVNIADLIDADAGEAWSGARDRAVLLLLYGCGLRISEALSLTGKDFPLSETLVIKGKGGKERVVPIIAITREAVAEYVAACPWPVVANEPLFRGVKGAALSPGMVQRAVARARRALGLPDTATPHALRHSFATHLLSAGVDLRSLQELLGHASLGSTQIYTKVDAAQMLEDYRGAHPRAGKG